MECHLKSISLCFIGNSWDGWPIPVPSLLLIGVLMPRLSGFWNHPATVVIFFVSPPAYPNSVTSPPFVLYEVSPVPGGSSLLLLFFTSCPSWGVRPRPSEILTPFVPSQLYWPLHSLLPDLSPLLQPRECKTKWHIKGDPWHYWKLNLSWASTSPCNQLPSWIRHRWQDDLVLVPFDNVETAWIFAFTLPTRFNHSVASLTLIMKIMLIFTILLSYDCSFTIVYFLF